MASDHGFGVRGETLANPDDDCTCCSVFPGISGERLASVPRRCTSRPARPPGCSPRRFVLGATLLLGAALAGCGKSLPGEEHDRGAGVTVLPGAGALAASGLATRNTTRLGGASAAADAAAVALAVYPGLTPATRPAVAVLVNENDWAAALAAAALAGVPLDAPLLYSEGNTLPRRSPALYSPP